MITTMDDLVSCLYRGEPLLALKHSMPLGASLDEWLLLLAEQVSAYDLDRLGKLLGIVRFEFVPSGATFIEKDTALRSRIVEYLNESTFCHTTYTFVPRIKGCPHNWQHYVGFTQSYKYCTKCDVKK